MIKSVPFPCVICYITITKLKQNHLTELTTNNTKREELCVRISEETRWVGFNLRDSEPGTGINSIGQNSSLEWALETADAIPVTVVANRVGEGNARWSRCTLQSLMNVCCCESRTHVFADDVEEGDILGIELAFEIV